MTVPHAVITANVTQEVLPVAKANIAEGIEAAADCRIRCMCKWPWPIISSTVCSTAPEHLLNLRSSS